ncbi:MAG TPA: phosphoenolpyruvate carboxylase [Vicinamibacterales bacterium]|nr:phosphoenolpyruvate carboxylase [Vicinamibacterales bacterium]
MNNPHQPLRDDVHLLGELLGETLRAREGEALFQRVESVRAMAKASRAGDDRALDLLTDVLGGMPIEAAAPVARAFAHFLALANVAEQHHRIRRRRAHARDGASAPQRGSCVETFRRLTAGGVDPSALAAAVLRLRIELVLTAHPTEIMRRTLIHKYNRVAQILALRDRPDLTPAEHEDSVDALRREIAAAWQTDEARETRVTPLDEVRAGLVVFEESLWNAVPAFLRDLDRALRAVTGRRLPLEATPITFGSWIGGDRDGNPNVTPEVTRQATWLARWQAAELYIREITALREELSLTPASPELRARTNGTREPYRALLRDVERRLRATRSRAAAAAQETGGADAVEGAYAAVADFAEPLQLCYRSLVDTGNELLAGGRLTDVLRRVATFGLVLARLDIRQDAARHAEAIDWLAKHSGVPIERAPGTVRDVVETFRVASEIHPESLGAYVVTMTRRADDVFAVDALQRHVGTRHPQRIVPLFETADDLAGAGDVLHALFADSRYRERIGGRQEVMVGYSDSAKDAGRFSAAWALYRAQETIVRVCAGHGVALTLFHGRGGSVGRGGGPTYLAIQSQPPGSVDAALRVTEQGEMIQAKFGLAEIALRTLDVYTTATLDATLALPPAPRAEWRAAMDRLYADGRDAYRAVVADPRFVDYFRQATPEPELRTIAIGSRPARRPSAGAGPGDIAGLRAIPWQFAWMQTRLLLASWLGVETALDAAFARGDDRLLGEMYDQWPFFRSTIDLIEMVLAKADVRIAALYDCELVDADLQPLGAAFRAKLEAAIASTLRITRHRELVETNPVLRRSIDVRNPYVDPINLVQIELLRRMRKQHPDTGDDNDDRLHRAFVVTVNGIAAGLRNTG